jgi:DNA (cytosine-5)-methyltransferase 1
MNEDKLNAISVFSGIGGFELALSEYCRTMLYCEKDKHAQGILLSRMVEGKIDCAPICTDIREITAEFIDIPIDIIFGGFPCQDISVAGNGRGLEGKRSGLFFEIVRLAKEIKPTFLFLENVPAIRTRGLDRVIQELTEVGYDCRWSMLSAAEVGANHKRERWFLLAYSNRSQLERRRLSGRRKKKISNTGLASWWEVEPHVGRMADEFPFRMDRLKRLGNAVVPLQAKTAFEYLMGIK